MNVVEFYTKNGWRVTSPYGERNNPLKPGTRAMHYGVDLGGKPLGEPIPTPVTGTVRTARLFKDAGNAVAIKSTKTGLILLFFHLHTLRVKPGQIVKAGDVIGTNGATGYATGPHLHLEIRHDKGEHFGSSRPAWGDPAKYSEISASEPSPDVYIVKPGDTFYGIAQRFGHTVPQLAGANNHIKDPAKIYPGDKIYLPPKGK